MHMRGGACVKVKFPNRDRFTDMEPAYPIFKRDHLLADKALVTSKSSGGERTASVC